MARHFPLRKTVQLLWAAATNSYATGFVQGKLYKGGLKTLCVPGLNCYSCPGALGSCPIGALQAVLSSNRFVLSCYVFGFLTLVGAVCGRFICGWLCPFGLFQELLHKIPFVKKIRTFPGDRPLRYLKYAVLLVLVILLPMFALDVVGQGEPWFCKWLCPAGTLEGGIPLVLLGEGFRDAAGWLFNWKLLVLVAVVLASVAIYRPFCRYLCPLGAIYALFNPVSLYRLHLDKSKCTDCGACERACGMCVDARKTPNSPECVRCGKCVRACPTGALRHGTAFSKPNNAPSEQRSPPAI